MYVELHCHSYYSLLDGASGPDELVRRAAALGYSALALTDHDALYGAIEFKEAAERYGIHPLYGAELTLHDQSHLTLLVADASGWSNLCRLLTLARGGAEKGAACLPAGALDEHAEGLIAFSGCRQGAVSAALLGGRRDAALAAARSLRTTFGPDNLFIELQHHLRPDDDWLNASLAALAQYLDLPLVATNNVHYAVPEQKALQDVLVCIRHNTTLDESERLRRPNREFYLKSPAELQQRFEPYPEALANSVAISERCRFQPQFGLQTLPEFPTPQRTPPIVYLRELCDAALNASSDPARYRDQLLYELGVIERAGFANYFLIIWDIMQYARRNGIRCQGRGSAANSLTAYLLGISPINPFEHNLVFERFLSDERAQSGRAVPDIDVDFDNQRREEVIQYVYGRYGRAHAAMACTFSTFRSRSAVRDVAKVLGLTPQQAQDALLLLDSEQQPQPETLEMAQLLQLVDQLRGLPRHLGQHSGGMVLSNVPLATRIPIEPAAMADRSVVQWDKDSLEAAGIAKFDILGLGMLAAIDGAVRLLQTTQADAEVDPLPITFDDERVYRMATDADTLGVFQIESRAQAQVLPKLKPRCFNDLIIAISLIRPGPLQGNMVQPFLNRRRGAEPVTHLHPLLAEALGETLGVIIFQEQVIKVARSLAGFSAGQGELLRRALGKKNAYAAIEALHQQFVAGATAQGVTAAIAEQVFDQLKAFGGYSFAKSHAAAFAVLVYQSAWLRCYHPAVFYCALLNNQPMGFWSPAVLLGDAKRRGIETLPVDIRHSNADCTIEGAQLAVRLGLRYVKGISSDGALRLQAERDRRPFRDLGDLFRRSHLSRRLVENLIAAGALDCWGGRQQLLWQLGRLRRLPNALPLPPAEQTVTLPPLDAVALQRMELATTGVTTGPHPLQRLRPALALNVLDSRQLLRCRNGQRVSTAGLVVVRQAPPTAKGMRFYTLEDEFGLINVVIRPNIYQRYRTLANRPLLLVDGIVEHDGQTNVVATRLQLLSVQR